MLSLVSGLGFLLRTSLIMIPASPGVLTLPEVIVYASDGLEKSSGELFLSLFSVKGLVVLTLVVSALIAIRFLVSLLYLLGLGKIQKRIRIKGLLVIPIRGDRSPFSFFRMVFIPERLIGEPSLEQVLLHEQAHIRKLHSLDLIFTEFLTIIFWFHPAIWYLRRELKLQHEYEADQFVLRFADRLEYQQLLLSFSFIKEGLPITNPFNFSPLKKRIMMMNKQTRKSKTRLMVSMFASMALFAGMLLLQSAGVVASQPLLAQNDDGTVSALVAGLLPEELPQTSVSSPPVEEPEQEPDVIFTVVEEQPRFPGGEEARVQYMVENLRYPEEARHFGLQGTVFVTFVVETDGSISNVRVLRGIGGGCDEEAVRVISNMPKWAPGRQRGQNVRVQYNMPIRFVLNDTEKEQDSSETEEIRMSIRDEEVIIYVDGERVDVVKEKLNEIISPDEIESINVYKGEQARELYGHDSVIAITRKK